MVYMYIHVLYIQQIFALLSKSKNVFRYTCVLCNVLLLNACVMYFYLHIHNFKGIEISAFHIPSICNKITCINYLLMNV